MTKLFFSYSHKDEDLRDELETHLATLKREGLIEAFHDRRISAGTHLDDAIDAYLEEADVILCLVSPDFIDSEYCYSREMSRALQRDAEGAAKVIPVICRHCDWPNTPLAKLRGTPRDNRPVKSWPDRDEAWLDVARDVRTALLATGGGARAAEGNAAVMSVPASQAASVVARPRSPNVAFEPRFTELDQVGDYSQDWPSTTALRARTRILHLSDIHFRAPQCLDAATDRDLPYRTRLERHLVQQVAAIGPIEVILVGGDIAFQADPREFEVARQWLLNLATMCGCDAERIMVVPGNHDINRKACEAAPTMNVHAMIALAAPETREWMLEKQIGHNDTAQALFHGHEAYNDFARKMHCQVYAGRIYWKQEIPLSEDVQLRIHGLTSTLLSGRNGKDDARGSLYLSELQTTLNPAPNVVNMTICHHPPDWLVDGDDIQDRLNARAMLQVFGHKHRQRVTREASYVRWGAGAVNPSRSERQFEPGYNIIELDVAGEGADRRIDVRSHMFKLQSNPERFHPIKNDTGGDVFQHSIPFPGEAARVNAAVVAASVTKGASEAAEPNAAPVTAATDAEASMGDKRTRHLVDRFWDLDTSDRREIALDLGLITPDEIQLPEAQRYGAALIRAAERDLLGRLEEMVAERK